MGGGGGAGGGLYLWLHCNHQNNSALRLAALRAKLKLH